MLGPLSLALFVSDETSTWQQRPQPCLAIASHGQTKLILKTSLTDTKAATTVSKKPQERGLVRLRVPLTGIRVCPASETDQRSPFSQQGQSMEGVYRIAREKCQQCGLSGRPNILVMTHEVLDHRATTDQLTPFGSEQMANY